MTRDEAIAILGMPRDKAINTILALADKAEKYDQLCGQVSATTPSGMTPVYLKPTRKKKKKKPGQKKGHKGISRKLPEKVDHYEEHTLESCPNCQTPVTEPIKSYTRYIEDYPTVMPEVTQHTLYGYWCPKCKKPVFPKVKDALPNAMIGLRIVIFTAWLHYLVGVSVNNIVKMLSIFSSFKISAGGLTQQWQKLASLLKAFYDDIGNKVSHSAVLYSDETGWRINGLTHWLWCFANKKFCYYIITKSRGSPVLKDFLGDVFKGILVCDFWGAYNKISALAKQRCYYHLFTELSKVDKKNTSDEWKAFRKKLYRLLKDALRLSDKKELMDQKNYEHRKNLIRIRFEILIETTHVDKDVIRIIKRLKRHKNEIFTFLDYEDVSPYNNHAEQQMRKPVITRKISQQNRSKEGSETQAILMTLFRSAELHGNNPVEAVVSLAKYAIDNQLPSEGYFKEAA